MNVLLNNLHLINPLDNIDGIYNIFIRSGYISELSKDEIKTKDAEIEIDCSGLKGIPGLFDLFVDYSNVNLNKKSLEIESIEALNGGITGFSILPNLNQIIDNIHTYEYYNLLKNDLPLDIVFHPAITKSLEGNSFNPLYNFSNDEKIIFTDSPESIQNLSLLREIIRYLDPEKHSLSFRLRNYQFNKNFNASESDTSVRMGLEGLPELAETTQLLAYLAILDEYNNFVVNFDSISASKSIEYIKLFDNKNTASINVFNLFFNESIYEKFNTFLKFNPPIRNENDRLNLLKAIQNDEIKYINSAHTPVEYFDKELEYDNGRFGSVNFKSFLMVLLTLIKNNELTLNDIIYKCSINPREYLNLKPIHFRNGEKINLCIFDDKINLKLSAKDFRGLCNNSALIGFELIGKVHYTIIGNKFHRCENG